MKKIKSKLITLCLLASLAFIGCDMMGGEKPEKTTVKDTYTDIGLSEEGSSTKSEDDSKIVVENLSEKGLEADKDYTVTDNGDGTITITLTDSGIEKIGNQVDAQNGKTKGEKLAIELDGDFGLVFEEGTKDYYATIEITKYFEELPALGDKVTLSTTFVSNQNIPEIKASLYFKDADYKSFEMTGTAVTFASDVVAGEETTVKKATLTVDRSVGKNVFLSLHMPKEDYKDVTILEIGNGLPSTTKHMSLAATNKGIEVTINNFNDAWRKDSGGSISVLGQDIKILQTNENIENKVTKYVYPFAEKDKPAYVRFSTNVTTEDGKGIGFAEYAKITPTASVSVANYANNIDKLKASKYEIIFDPFTGAFNGKLTTTLESFDSVLDPEKVVVCGGINLVLGNHQWNPGKWLEGNSIFESIDENSNPYIATWSESYSTLNAYDAFTKGKAVYMWGSAPTAALWKEYNSKYWGSFFLQFKTADYPDQTFELPPIVSEEYIFTPDTTEKKTVDFDAALKAGITEVTTYPTTEAELISMFTDVAADFEAIEDSFGDSDSDYDADRAMIKAENALDALKQIEKVMNDVLTTVTDLEEKITALTFDGKINLDISEEINIGQLTTKEWLYVLLNTYDNVRAKLNEATNNQYWYLESSSALMADLYEELEEYNITIDQVCALVDSCVTINQLNVGVAAKADVNASTLCGTAETSFKAIVSAGITNIDATIASVLKVVGITETVKLPVKAITVDVNAEASAKATVKSEVVSEASAEVKVDFKLSTALCSSKGTGGIFSIAFTTDVKTDDIDDFLTLVNSSVEGAEISEEQILKIVKSLDESVKLKLTVSDGTTDKFSQEYTALDILEKITEIMEGEE